MTPPFSIVTVLHGSGPHVELLDASAAGSNRRPAAGAR